MKLQKTKKMKLSDSELIDLVFKYDVDPFSNRVLLNGYVDDYMNSKLLGALTVLTQSSPERIQIVLNTFGGDAFSAFAIYDTIKRSPIPIDILVNGPCMSAGTLILQAAQERAATSNSAFMIHYGEVSNRSKAEERFNRSLDGRWLALMTERLPTSQKEQAAKWHEQETFFTAQQALEVGLIDRIV